MEKLLFLKRRKKHEGKNLTLESSKSLGGIGAILLLIGVLPYISEVTFGIIAIVGIIAILVALHGLANVYNEKGIFNYSLYGLIAGIVGGVIAGVVVVVAVLSNLKTLLQDLYPSWNGKWTSISSLSGMTPQTSNINTSTIFSLIAGALVAFVIFWIFLIIWAVLARKSLKMLADKSGTGLFGTASLLLIIGAALTIIGIGLILLWVGVLLMAIAFFQLKPQTEQPQATYAAPPTTPTPV
jgi:uncharacterized membrane protein